MLFATLSDYLFKLEQTSSRNRITEVLAEVFKKVNKEEIDKVCYLVLGRVAPQYTGVEFNLAERMMVRALARAYSMDVVKVLSFYKQRGDLGEVVQNIAKRKTQNAKQSELTVRAVYDRLYKVATEAGAGSQERKIAGMADLLKKLDPLSVRYVVRIPLAKLRLGFSDATILDALSVMEVGDKSKRKAIEGVYNVAADIGAVAGKIKRSGLRGLGKAEAVPGIPIRSSLADRLPNVEKIIEKLGPEVAVEPKFDGLRTQLHLTNGKKRKVTIFSRNHENITAMFPDIVKAAASLPVGSAIFDAETIGFNPKTGKFIPFQETVQRKRKYEIVRMAKKVPLKVFVFDLLYLNGATYLTKPFEERRRVLEKILARNSGNIVLTEQFIVDNPLRLKKLAQEYISDGLEGMMAKKLSSPYEAGSRGFHWVKYKRHTEQGLKKGLADTLDCVLMGAYKGRGKRAQFGVGSFLLGVVRGEKYYTISNLGTGLTDEQFKEMGKVIEKLKLGKKPQEYVVDKTVEPDIWVRPKLVLEILADEITLSPRHTAGRTKEGTKGYSLRFPRLVRVRADKNPTQATSVAEVVRLFKFQKS